MTDTGEEGDAQDASLGDLVARVIDNAKTYLRAEVTLIRQTIATRVAQIRPALLFVVAAVLLVQAALIVLVAALGMLLAIWIGAAGGLAVAALLALIVAGLLGWAAVARFTGSAP